MISRPSSPIPIFLRRVFLLVSLVLCSCGNGNGARIGAEIPKELKEKSDVPNRPTIKRPKPPGVAPPMETVFDFASHLENAHLRSGGLLIDLGTPSRHKYTLGNWKSGWDGDHEKDGTTYSLLKGPATRLFFDLTRDETKEARITIRARGETRPGIKIYLNGEYKGSVEFAKDRFSHGSISVEEDLVVGQNELLFRCEGPTTRARGRSGCLAVDYIRITSMPKDNVEAAAAFDSVRYPDAKGGPDGILLAASESLTFHLPISSGMRIRGEGRARSAETRAGFEVVATSNSGKPKNLYQREFKGGTTRLDIDLDTLGGDSAAISFRALTGEVVLSGLRMVSNVPPQEPAPGRPKAKNVVLVLIDTLRADRLSLYNEDTRVRTACLDMLGKESMIFERAMAPENWTKPSVASLLTGLYPSTHKAKDDRDKLPGSVTMATEHFQELGFETAGFVANGYVSGKFGFRQGWNTWTNYVREGKANRAKYVFEDASKWLITRRSEKPFFLYVHTIDPHVPYIPPEKYLKMYDTAGYNGPIKSTKTAHQLGAIKTGKLKLTDRDKIRLEALYDGEITYHDDQLLGFFETLKSEGLLEDTLLIVTSDHGEEFFEHGSVGHGHSMYEELLHVPLMVRLPGATAGSPRNATTEVNLVDVLPTICDLLGVRCPSGVEGRSLAPLLEGKTRGSYPGFTFSEFLGGQLAARMGRYKIIYRGLNASLYDLTEDPRETDNVNDERPVTIATMRDALGMHMGALTESGSSSTKSKKKHKTVKASIDDETKAQLKALGYLIEE